MQAPREVADLVQDHEPQIALKGPLVLRLEGPHSIERSNHGLLNQVIGVDEAARISWKPPARPLSKERQEMLEETTERGAVPIADVPQEDQRLVDIAGRRGSLDRIRLGGW